MPYFSSLNSTISFLYFSFFSYLLVQIFKTNKFIFIVFFLPSTFLHELAHYIVSFLTLGKPISFSIIPRKNILGYVISSNYNVFNGVFISFAPFLNLFIGYLFFTSNLGYIKYLFSFYFIVSGIPSYIDFKNSVKSLLLYILIFLTIYLFQAHFDIIREMLNKGVKLCLDYF